MNCNKGIAALVPFRKLTNLERLFLFNPECKVSLICKIVGNVSDISMQDAMLQAVTTYPLLGARIYFDPQNEAHFITNDGLIPPIEFIDRTSDEKWKEEFSRVIKMPFHLESGPLIRFVVIHSPEVSDLLIISHHVICDGMSLVNVTKKLLSIMGNDNGCLMVDRTPINQIADTSTTKSSAFEKLIGYYLNKKWDKKPFLFSPNDYDSIHAAYSKKYSFSTICLEVPSDQLSHLVTKSKEERVRLGSVFLLAFLTAISQIDKNQDSGTQKITIPFDLRRHRLAADNPEFGLSVGIPHQIVFSPKNRNGFWEDARRLQKQIFNVIDASQKTRLTMPTLRPAFLDALSCFAFFKERVPEAFLNTDNLKLFFAETNNISCKLTRAMTKNISNIIFSNLGRLDIAQNYGNLRLEKVTFLPAALESVPLTIGGACIGDKAVLSINFAETVDKQLQITDRNQHICDRVSAFLKALC